MCWYKSGHSDGVGSDFVIGFGCPPSNDLPLAQQFAREGMRVAPAHEALRVERSAAGGGSLVCVHDGREVTIAFDTLLVALGRKANVAGFGLEDLGVRLRHNGTVDADPLLRTNFPNILVCGDVTGPFQFTHVAAHQTWYAAINGLLAPL